MRMRSAANCIIFLYPSRGATWTEFDVIVPIRQVNSFIHSRAIREAACRDRERDNERVLRYVTLRIMHRKGPHTYSMKQAKTFRIVFRLTVWCNIYFKFRLNLTAKFIGLHWNSWFLSVACVRSFHMYPPVYAVRSQAAALFNWMSFETNNRSRWTWNYWRVSNYCLHEKCSQLLLTVRS